MYKIEGNSLIPLNPLPAHGTIKHFLQWHNTLDSYICKSENFSGRGDFSEPNKIFIGFCHDPVTYVLSKRQAVSRAFDKG